MLLYGINADYHSYNYETAEKLTQRDESSSALLCCLWRGSRGSIWRRFFNRLCVKYTATSVGLHLKVQGWLLLALPEDREYPFKVHRHKSQRGLYSDLTLTLTLTQTRMKTGIAILKMDTLPLHYCRRSTTITLTEGVIFLNGLICGTHRPLKPVFILFQKRYISIW